MAIYVCETHKEHVNVIGNIAFVIYLDSREGDSRGGIGANHQRHDG